MDRHPGRFTLQFSRVVLLSVARWQSGYAADCNSVYAGSIPTRASNFPSGSVCYRDEKPIDKGFLLD